MSPCHLYAYISKTQSFYYCVEGLGFTVIGSSRVLFYVKNIILHINDLVP